LSAQTFHVSDTLVNIIKPSNDGVVHYYSEIYNDTQDTLFMRWISNSDPEYPTNWITYFQDPQTFYNPLLSLDSGDFYLGTSHISTDKLIYQVDHQGHVGRSSTIFKVFPINNRADVIYVTFFVKITQAPSTLGIEEIRNLNSNIQYKSIHIYNALGELLMEYKNSTLSQIFHSEFSGLVFINTTDFDDKTNHIKLYLK
jgi:hypothetical protein